MAKVEIQKVIEKTTQPTKFWKKQWPWWIAGLLTGLAEAINYWFIPVGHPKHKFIGVTSGMARMLAGFESLLTGASLIATKPDYQPDIQWVIIGAILSGLIFGWLEKDLRSWTYYPKKFLAFTALGAFLFAWGTRVAGGCTLHHLLGGWPAMNVKSFVVMIVATFAAVIGIWIMSKFRLTPYFRSQDTRWYIETAKELGWADGITINVRYDPMKDWLRLALYAFWVVFAIGIIYMAFFGNYYAVNKFGIPFEKTKIAKSMLTLENLPNILLLLVIGGLLGLSVAKTGFGTECAILDFEMGQLMAGKKEFKFGREWGFTYSIRTVFKSMGPFVALAVHMLIASTAFFLGWVLFGIIEGHHTYFYSNGGIAEMFHGNSSIRNYPNLVLDIFGGFLLGIGTVFMLGCEFRNYGRTGLLYITGLVIWPFFYLGYLPYTLARDFWDSIMADKSLMYAKSTFLPAIIAPNNPEVWSIIWLLYILLWVGLLVWALKFGAKNIGVTVWDLLTKSSEELYLLRIQKLQKENPEFFEELDKVEKELVSQAAP